MLPLTRATTGVFAGRGVWMGPSRRAIRACFESWRRSGYGVCAAIVLALTTAGCATTGQVSLTGAAPPHGPTVAFESIDGPPESTFHALVQKLAAEADARQIAVVSRAETAQYRVRSYMAAIVHNNRSTVAWVWDVYDAGQRRAVRISGEEAADSIGRGTWAVVDDAVLGRIARSGMDRLVAFLATSGTDQDSSPAAPRRPAVAAATADEVLPPQDRPRTAGFAPGGTLAYAPPAR